MEKVNRCGFMRIQLPNGKFTYAPMDENNKPIKVARDKQHIAYERFAENLKRLDTTEDEIYQIAMEKYNENHKH